MQRPSFSARALWSAAFASLMVAAAAAHAARPAQWTFTNLGPAGSINSVAMAVNNRGDIVGDVRVALPDGRFASHAAVWESGEFRDLGAELGAPPGEAWTHAEAVNDRGTVVVSGGPDGLATWRDGVWTVLGIREASAHDINHSGAIVGNYRVSGAQHAFLYRNGVLQDLGELGGGIATAEAINDRGIVVGWGFRADFSAAGFVYEDGVRKELGTFGGRSSQALDVNDRGTVVGFAQDASGRSIAFMTDRSGELRPVADLEGNSTAWAINRRGAIVGSSDSHAFLVEDGEVTFLDELAAVKAAGFTQIFPLGINDRGWIVGWGWRPAGNFEPEAFVLVPR
jgi:probable HAF family extracellular repeat protein